jgi:hypothetical protein
MLRAQLGLNARARAPLGAEPEALSPDWIAKKATMLDCTCTYSVSVESNAGRSSSGKKFAKFWKSLYDEGLTL